MWEEKKIREKSTACCEEECTDFSAKILDLNYTELLFRNRLTFKCMVCAF